MQGLIDYLADNAADLLFNIAFCLIVYLIARFMRASPTAALIFAMIPLGVIFVLQNPAVPGRLVAMLG